MVLLMCRAFSPLAHMHGDRRYLRYRRVCLGLSALHYLLKDIHHLQVCSNY